MDTYGYTAFVLLVTDEQLPIVKRLATQYKDIMDVSTKEYGSKGFWFLELEVLDGTRPNKEIADFIFRTFPFIATRQKGSTYIVAKDKDSFKDALLTLFNKDTKIEFLYNMLSIDERYDALEEACSQPFTYFDSIRIQKWIGGCMYSLLYTKGQPCIFSEDPEIDLLFEDYGVTETVDMTEGLNIFTFHVAILREKS